tara:strand:+ start:1631 stop:1927 length:297 start_codon:yes stop_codon:yes gene_type:complete
MTKRQADNLRQINQLQFSIPASAKILGWNARRLWDLVHEHRDAILSASCINAQCVGQCRIGIPSVRIGKRYFITKEALVSYVKRLREDSFYEVIDGKR